MAALLDKLNRIAPWRFLMFFALLLITSSVAGRSYDWSKSVLFGFDLAAICFLAGYLPLYGFNSTRLREVAEENDANRGTLLAIVFAACCLSCNDARICRCKKRR